MCFKCYRSRDLIHQSHRFTAKYQDLEYEEDETTSSDVYASDMLSGTRHQFTGAAGEEAEDEVGDDNHNDNIKDDASSEASEASETNIV